MSRWRLRCFHAEAGAAFDATSPTYAAEILPPYWRHDIRLSLFSLSRRRHAAHYQVAVFSFLQDAAFPSATRLMKATARDDAVIGLQQISCRRGRILATASSPGLSRILPPLIFSDEDYFFDDSLQKMPPPVWCCVRHCHFLLHQRLQPPPSAMRGRPCFIATPLNAREYETYWLVFANIFAPAEYNRGHFQLKLRLLLIRYQVEFSERQWEAIFYDKAIRWMASFIIITLPPRLFIQLPSPPPLPLNDTLLPFIRHWHLLILSAADLRSRPSLSLSSEEMLSLFSMMMPPILRFLKRMPRLRHTHKIFRELFSFLRFRFSFQIFAWKTYWCRSSFQYAALFSRRRHWREISPGYFRRSCRHDIYFLLKPPQRWLHAYADELLFSSPPFFATLEWATPRCRRRFLLVSL